MKKRMSKLFLTVAMVITLMSVMSVTAAATNYNLWVCGVQVTSENCDKITEAIPAEKGTVTGEITYDPDTEILTLKNADIDVAGGDIQGIKVESMALTLNLVGNNKVTNDSGSHAIYVGRYGSLTINGSGSLTAKNSADSYSCIRSRGPLVIQSGTVTATATGNNAGGIFAQEGVTISGGKVTAKGVDENGNTVSDGINADDTDIIISGGEVEAIGRCGIYTSSGEVKISGGKVTATGNGGDYYGIRCRSINISQDDPLVETLVIVTNNSYGPGLYSTIGSITISGGTVIASGDDGIYASNSNVTISGGTVTATGSNRGIRASDNVTISGSTVTAKGSSSFGIYSGSSNVKISGDTVTASGSKAINCNPDVTGIPATHQIFVGSDMSGAGAAAWDNSTSLNTYQYINIGPAPILVSSITLDPSSIDLVVGETKTLTAAVLPADADNKTVTWSSDNASVATVANGVVTAADAGTATITATAADGSGVSATCVVTVNAVTHTITKADTENGTVTVDITTAADGETVTITATPNTGYEVEDIKVYKTGDEGSTVEVTDNKFEMPAHDVTVSVTFKRSIVSVTGVTLNATEIDLTVGNTETLTPTVTPAEATNQAVTWTSSDSTVATVRNGLVTAVGVGTTTITVTTADGSYTDTCDVTVGYPLWVGGVQVSPTNADDVLGDGTVSFNPTTNTLTLDNFHCTIEDTDEYYAGVETSIEDLTILLRGNNSITVENYGNGIVAYRNVTIRDDDTDNSVGSLQITSYHEGLYCYSDLNVENVRLDVASEGNVGIFCDGNFKVVNSVIDAVGYDGAISCYTLPNLNGEHKVYTGFFKPELVEVENPDESDYEEWCVRIAPSSLVYYPVWIGETQFTSDCLTIAGDSGTATLTVGNDNGTPTYTLTLDNFSYSGEGILYSGLEATRNYCALYTNEDLTILLRGNNSLSCAGSYEHGYYNGIVATVIYDESWEELSCCNLLTICDDPNHSGTGKLAVNSGTYGIDARKIDVLNCSLDVTVDGEDRDWSDAIGIYTEDNINIQGSEVTVTVGAATGENGYSYGICEAEGVTVEDGTLIVTAADQAFYSDYEITVHAENAIVYVGVDEASAEAAGPVSDDDKREFDTYTNKYVRIEHTAPPVYVAVTTYPVEVKAAANGTLKAGPISCTEGATVTIYAKPAEGYLLTGLTVLDKDGQALELTRVAEGRYTFKMPASKVTVSGSFLKFFTDVPASTYYYDAVMWAVQEGITNGTSATTFSPDASCTRAQMVTFLWRAAGSPEPTATTCPFTDVDMDSYYGKAVLWAAENGITCGTSATTFSPDATVTRAQTVTFLWRVAGSPAAKQTASFDDVAADSYYHDAVVWAADEAITSGTSATTFSPADPCLRSQIVTFLYRYYVD